MTPLCRVLTSTDASQILALYQTLSTGHTLPARTAIQSAFDRVLAHPGTQVLGALDGELIVSMATLHILPNMTYAARPYGVIENVATLPDHQGRGFGRAVMQAAADAAWAADAYKIMLLTGQENGARGFYEKLGYASEEKHGLILRRT